MPICNEPEIHPEATVHPTAQVWGYATVFEGAEIGANVSVGRFAMVGPGVRVGPGTRIQEGARLFEGCVVGRRVFIGPNATVCNHRYPRVRKPGEAFEPQTVRIEDDAIIGANSTLVPPITVGQGATVGAHSVVVRDVPAGAVVAGTPAREIRSKRR